MPKPEMPHETQPSGLLPYVTPAAMNVLGPTKTAPKGKPYIQEVLTLMKDTNPHLRRCLDESLVTIVRNSSATRAANPWELWHAVATVYHPLHLQARVNALQSETEDVPAGEQVGLPIITRLPRVLTEAYEEIETSSVLDPDFNERTIAQLSGENPLIHAQVDSFGFYEAIGQEQTAQNLTMVAYIVYGALHRQAEINRLDELYRQSP